MLRISVSGVPAGNYSLVGVCVTLLPTNAGRVTAESKLLYGKRFCSVAGVLCVCMREVVGKGDRPVHAVSVVASRESVVSQLILWLC